MSVNVSPNNVIDFQNTFDDIAQERQSKFEGTSVVSMEAMNGKSKAIDSIGSLEAVEITGRVVNVQFDDIDHLRRQLSTKRYKLTIPVDAADVQDLARDPSGRYAEECVNAFNRLKDRIVVNAATADVLTGEDMSTAVNFATDGGRTVDATAGFTYAKLLEIKGLQGAVATGSEFSEQSLLAITDSEQKNLLTETELTSSDFGGLFKRDDNGVLVKVLGIDIIQFASATKEPILKVAAGARDCLAFAGNAMAMGMHTAPAVDILDLESQFYQTKAVNIIARMGAVRREGARVLKVQTTA